MYRKTVFAILGLVLLAGPAPAKDDLPPELRRQVDPITTATVSAPAPARLSGKVFVHPSVDQDQLPVELSQDDNIQATASASAEAPAQLRGKVFVYPNLD